jgi:hypothetical protein
MKIINAIPGFGTQLSEQRVKDFLVNSKLNHHLATTHSCGNSVIHHVWYLNNDIGKFIISQIKENNKIILEITPRYYSAWSFGN